MAVQAKQRRQGEFDSYFDRGQPLPLRRLWSCSFKIQWN